MIISHIIAQVSNCAPSDGNNCLINVPTPGSVDGGTAAVQVILGIVFGVLGALSVIMIIIQAIKFTLSNGDPEKATSARKSIIYALIGLGIAISAEVIVNLVIGKL